MSNKEKLEAELKTQYELITGEQKTVTEGVFDAVHAATGQEMTEEELDLVGDYEITTFQEFLDWLIDKIVQFVKWLKDWWNSED